MKTLSTALIAALSVTLAMGQTPPPGPTPPPPAPTPPPPSKGGFDASKLIYGGYVGASFGDVDIVEISPRVGYRFHPKFHAGIGLTYRHTSDDRYAQDLEANDYGGDVFAAYSVVPRLHLLAEYHWLSYEVVDVTLQTDRLSDSSIFGGAGFVQPLGGRAGLYMDALYNFSYDENDLYSPYDSPWVYRVGVGVGF